MIKIIYVSDFAYLNNSLADKSKKFPLKLHFAFYARRVTAAILFITSGFQFGRAKIKNFIEKNFLREKLLKTDFRNQLVWKTGAADENPQEPQYSFFKNIKGTLERVKAFSKKRN